MKKTRTHCPNCMSEYEYRARVCHQCGRRRDQIVTDEAKRYTSSSPKPSSKQKRNVFNSQSGQDDLDRDVSPEQPYMSPTGHSNRYFEVPKTEPGVTYRPRDPSIVAYNNRTNFWIFGAMLSCVSLLLVVGGFRVLYEATKPKVKVVQPTFVQPSPSLRNQVSDDELEHIRFMRAKNAKDLRESIAYTKSLADKVAEQKRLGEERQFIESLRENPIRETDPRGGQDGTSSARSTGYALGKSSSQTVHTGPRGGQYVITSGGNKRYLSSSSSSGGNSAIHTGPRGGQYVINKNGNKQYVPRSSSSGGYSKVRRGKSKW